MVRRSLILNFLKGVSSSNFAALHRSCDVFYRSYSVYAPKYIEPIFEKSKLEELDPANLKNLASKAVKAATPSQTSSVFHDPLLSKFTNLVMKGGRKDTARKIISEAFEKVKLHQIKKYHSSEESKRGHIKLNPLEIFHEAITNIRPVLSFTIVRKGGTSYKVPVPIEDHKATWTAMKWLILVSREHPPRRKHTDEYFCDRLYRELINAAENSGKCVQKKLELHKTCEANRAFAHFRWS